MDYKDWKLEELKLISDDYEYRDRLIVTEFALSMTAVALAVNAALSTECLLIQIFIFLVSSLFTMLIVNHMRRLNVDRISAGGRRHCLLLDLKMHQCHTSYVGKQAKMSFSAPEGMIAFTWLVTLSLIVTFVFLLRNYGKLIYGI